MCYIFETPPCTEGPTRTPTATHTTRYPIPVDNLHRICDRRYSACPSERDGIYCLRPLPRQHCRRATMPHLSTAHLHPFALMFFSTLYSRSYTHASPSAADAWSGAHATKDSGREVPVTTSANCCLTPVPIFHKSKRSYCCVSCLLLLGSCQFAKSSNRLHSNANDGDSGRQALI